MMKFKKVSLKMAKIFLLFFLVFTISNRYISESEKKGSTYSPSKRINLKDGSSLTFPRENQLNLAIFWASWCTPCKIEMQRLKKVVESNPKLGEFIYAINLVEDETTIRKFISETNYPFQFTSSGITDRQMGVVATPTTIMIKNNKVEHFSQGMSLVGIWRAERFLKKNL